MTFEQIGQQLRTARDTLGLTLAQIQERTKIPFNHLQAIDNGQTEDLPEPVYVSGFIKRYAECVGLDGQRLSDEYKQVIEANNNPNGRFSLFPQPKPQKESSYMATVQAPVYYKNTKLAQSAPNILKSLPFYLFWVVVVLSLVTYLVTRQQTNEAGQQDPSVLALKQTTDKIANLPTPTVITNTGTVNETITVPSHTDARIALTASQHVWVEVKAVSSGDTVFTGFLERGDRKDFQDSQGLRVRAGNGGSLSIEQDGKSQTLGEPGKRAEKAFLVKGASAATASADNPDSKTAASKNNSTPSKKPTPAKKSTNGTTAKTVRRLEGLGTRRDLPGESLGGPSIDVPYRY